MTARERLYEAINRALEAGLTREEILGLAQGGGSV
jgi:hypothetical protein